MCLGVFVLAITVAEHSLITDFNVTKHQQSHSIEIIIFVRYVSTTLSPVRCLSISYTCTAHSQHIHGASVHFEFVSKYLRLEFGFSGLHTLIWGNSFTEIMKDKAKLHIRKHTHVQFCHFISYLLLLMLNDGMCAVHVVSLSIFVIENVAWNFINKFHCISYYEHTKLLFEMLSILISFIPSRLAHLRLSI